MTNNLMRPAGAPSAFSPPPINSVDDTGLNVLWLQDLALKILYNQGFMSGFKIAEAIALPFAGVMLLAIALWRGVRNDWKEEQRRERTLRKRMREMVDAPGR